MTTKNLLKNNRVFLSNSKKYGQSIVSCKVVQDWTEPTPTNKISIIKLYVDDTSDFAECGSITDGYYKYNYTSKGSNYFNIDFTNNNGVNSGGVIGIIFRNGTLLKQERVITDTVKLAGWYVDGNSQQATLKVSESPVIIPGAIRYLSGCDGHSGRFQGCIGIDESECMWVDFNAIEGPSGRDGNINTCLEYSSIGSGEGQIIKTNNIDVDSTKTNVVEVRSITAAKHLVNGNLKSSLEVKTDDYNVLIDVKGVEEVVYDLTGEVNNIKGNPKNDKILNCYGEQIRVRVSNCEGVKKGQVVSIEIFTDKETGKQYYGVKPMKLEEGNCDKLLKYQLSGNNMKYCFGLSRQDGACGDIVNILINGIGLLRIGNNVDGMKTISTTNVKYIGYPVLMDCDGYGFSCQDITKLPDPHMEIGCFMEYGSDICKTDNYVLVKFAPNVVDL